MAELKLKEKGHVLIEGQGRFVFFEDITDHELNRKLPHFWAYYNEAGELQSQSETHFANPEDAINAVTEEILRRSEHERP